MTFNDRIYLLGEWKQIVQSHCNPEHSNILPWTQLILPRQIFLDKTSQESSYITHIGLGPNSTYNLVL